MNGRYLHTLWCDDIRQEVGNKPSFMGVYTGGIVLPSLPIFLPRLCVWNWVATPMDQPFQNLSIQVIRDDGFVLVEVPSIDLNKALVEPEPCPDATRRSIMFGFQMGPIEVPVGCRYFQVIAQAESGRLEGPKLRIEIDASQQLDSAL